MPSYMLDTNAIIHLRQRRSPAMTERVASLPRRDAVMSVISYGELRNGAEKSRDRAARLSTLEAMRAIVEVDDLPLKAGAEYGEIRSYLERRGQLIGPNDLWIAAHARSAGFTLVTSNTREFQRVPGLQIADWT
jgi:tRNA(fMet)-specific endonuclease VapC